jgi:hypothetical protein
LGREQQGIEPVIQGGNAPRYLASRTMLRPSWHPTAMKYRGELGACLRNTNEMCFALWVDACFVINYFAGAGSGTRTRTSFPSKDFKSYASTYFAMPAGKRTSLMRRSTLA